MRQIGEFLDVGVATVVNPLNPQYVVIDSPFNRLESLSSAVIKTLCLEGAASNIQG